MLWFGKKKPEAPEKTRPSGKDLDNPYHRLYGKNRRFEDLVPKVEAQPTRKQNRLAGYDYSQNGAYFVTMCTKDRKNLFWADTGENVGARIARPREQLAALNANGKIVEEAIQNIPRVYPMITVEKYVIMPNHLHFLLLVSNPEGGRAMRAPTLSAMVNQMKGYASKRIGFPCWQKSFHDHIIRNQKDYEKIWEYIDTNPTRWKQDCFYCEE